MAHKFLRLIPSSFFHFTSPHSQQKCTHPSSQPLESLHDTFTGMIHHPLSEPIVPFNSCTALNVLDPATTTVDPTAVIDPTSRASGAVNLMQLRSHNMLHPSLQKVVLIGTTEIPKVWRFIFLSTVLRACACSGGMLGAFFLVFQCLHVSHETFILYSGCDSNVWLRCEPTWTNTYTNLV
jgi:hypothetical protein